MANYNSQYTGQQVDDAVQRVTENAASWDDAASNVNDLAADLASLQSAMQTGLRGKADIVQGVNVIKYGTLPLLSLYDVQKHASAPKNNCAWWSTDGHIYINVGGNNYDMGNPQYLLYYVGSKIYGWGGTSTGFYEIGGISADSIINGLTSTATDKVLSAYMGKVLKDNIEIVQANVMALYNALANMAYNGNKPSMTALNWGGSTTYYSVGITSNLGHCSLATSPSTTVAAGGSVTFIITPDDGYTLDGVTPTIAATAGSASYSTSNGDIVVMVSNITGNTMITVSATAVAVPVDTPTLTVTPSTIELSSMIGETKTATILVQGSNLTDDVDVDIEKTINTGISAWVIPSSNISAATANSGKTITVTWSPTDEGTDTVTITYASTGAVSKSVTITAVATASNVTKVVKGWGLAEDKTIKSQLISGGQAVDDDTYKWIFPRQPFDGTTPLNGHGTAVSANTIPANTVLCYTDYIQIPSASATSLYYRYVFNRSTNAEQNSDANIYCASIKFYRKSGNTYTPIWAKGATAGSSSRTLNSSNVGWPSDMFSGNIYARATFVMSGNAINSGCCLRLNNQSGYLIWPTQDTEIEYVNEPLSGDDEP